MNTRIPADLAAARLEIDAIDRQLVEVLARRQNVVERVISIKKRDSIPALIPERVDVVIENAAKQASAAGLSPDLARKVWKEMVEWFVDYENGQLNK